MDESLRKCLEDFDALELGVNDVEAAVADL
jgi:hypothetical protein